MRAILNRALVKPVGWLGLCYLGSWLALALERVCAQVIVLPLLGAPVADWRISAFRVTIGNADLPGGSSSGTLALAAPFLLEIIFLVGLAAFGGQIRSAAARIGLHFAGLWAVLQLAVQVTWFVYLGRGSLARLLAPFVGPAALTPARRIGWAVVPAVLLVVAGSQCAGRLMAEARRAWLPERRGWLAVPLVIFPVLVILLAAFNFLAALHYMGPRVWIYLGSPVALCLLAALLALAAKRTARPVTEFTGWSALAGLCLSAALFASLQEAPRLEPWLAERRLHSYSSAHYQILFDGKAYSPEAIRAFAEKREEILARAAERLNQPLDARTGHDVEIRLRIVLYPDLGALRAATGSARAWSVEGTTIRAALGDDILDLDPGADAAALLDAAWGRPGTPRIGEWVARWLAGEWRGRAINDWAGQIESEVGHYTLAKLVASSSDGFLSPLVRGPLGAAWVGTILDRSGLAAVPKIYSAKFGEPDLPSLAAQLNTPPAQLEQDWWEQMAGLASTHADPAPERPVDPSFFFRGISFSHEGWSGRGGGYISPEADAQLRQLRALGANAIAVVPYGFARGASEEFISYTDTDETDEDLTHALHVAHELGMKVMLKPQLWVRGEYPGAIRLGDAAARAAWMRNYREFILHYARLAELERFDLLCVGTEFAGLTPYADDWRRLIAEVRRVYHGPLTYAANWGQEFESIGFWDALDYIGVNNYYPLGAAPSTHVEDLLPGAQQLGTKFAAISRRWQRPILFTEVGYPSARGGASEPWIEDGSLPVSLEEQAAAYEATFRAFADQPWFRGMFWWKWPSSGRGGGSRDASYTPLGKPATEVLRAWFTRLAAARPQKSRGSAQAQ